jgi:hypothetical protein
VGGINAGLLSNEAEPFGGLKHRAWVMILAGLYSHYVELHRDFY